METTFPSGFGWATAFYLTMYLATFVLHQAFMHYVLAGSLCVAWTTVWRGRDAIPRTHQPLAELLRDWMPFLLSAAITAGVAPLLFIQIVYQYQFYTSSLLLWWRWMVLVPVLIAAFYLLYLLKSHLLWKWSHAIQSIVAVGTAACFVFTGFCWTVNHLLANSHADWPEIYTTGRLPFGATPIVLRMLIWLGASFASMAVIVGWQLVYRSKVTKEPAIRPNELAMMVIGGLLVAAIASVLYFSQCDERVLAVLLGPAFRLWMVVLIVSVIAEAMGWVMQVRSGRLGGAGLILASVSTLLSLSAIAVVREGIRVSSIDLNRLAERHLAATTMGGFSVFVIAALIVGGLIVLCIRIVATGMTGPIGKDEVDSVKR